MALSTTLVMLAAIVAITLVHAFHQQDARIKAAVERNHEIAEILARLLPQRYREILVVEGPVTWVDQGGLIEVFEGALGTGQQRGAVLRTQLINRAGLIVYDSRKDAVGVRAFDLAMFEKALGGALGSRIRDLAEASDATGGGLLLDLYVPVRSAEGDEVIGVMMVESDVSTPLIERVGEALSIAVVPAAVIIMLFFYLRGVARRAERELRLRIDERDQAVAQLSATHDELETRVHLRTEELRQRNEELHRTSQRLATIGRATSEAIVVMDDAGLVVEWNPAAERIFGHPAREVVGRPLHDFVACDEDRERFEQNLPRFSEHGTGAVVGTTREMSALRADGTTLPVELTVDSVQLEGRWHAIGLVHDIGDRKRLERALHNELATQKAQVKVLEIAIQSLPLKRKLQRILEHVLETPWLALEPRGAIFLTDDAASPGWLKLAAHVNLAEPIREACQRVAPGRCICGRAAETRELVFVSHVDESHETVYPGMVDHGHYCAPILGADGSMLGVLNTYVTAGHARREAEAHYIRTMATILAGVIQAHRAEHRLKMLSTAVEQSPATVVITDPEGVIEYVNPRFCELTGYREAEALGKKPNLLKSGQVPDEVYADLWRTITDGRVWRGELLNRKKSGELFWESEVIAPVLNQDGGIVRYVAVKEDVTDAKRNFEQLVLRDRAVEAASEGIALLRKEEGRFLVAHANRSFCALVDQEFDALVGQPWTTLPVSDRSAASISELSTALEEGRTHGATVHWRRNHGGPVWCVLDVAPFVVGKPESAYAVLTLRDVTDLVRQREEVERATTTDRLTGLPNRNLLIDRLVQAAAMARRQSSCFAVMVANIDEFRLINEEYGQDAADTVLTQLSRRLVETMREGDTVARPGGDEFVTIYAGLPDDTVEARLVSRLMSSVESPFEVGKASIKLTLTVGIAWFPFEGKDPISLYLHAGLALQKAKGEGRDRALRYRPDMSEVLTEKMRLKLALSHAVSQGELRVYYQPKLAMADGRIVGAEALVRWQHPELGLVPPFKFIPLAEETGLILEIGHWVISEVARQLRAWIDAGIEAVPVAVNLSARQFELHDLDRRILDQVHMEALDPGLFELEITESAVMTSPERAVATLASLREVGLKVAIDDFGTGHSSLSYLKRFTVDTLKIDRSFVSNITSDVSDRAIAVATLTMAHSLGCLVVAEGVETAEQFRYLREQGCDQMQGYLFSPPVPAEAFGAMLAEGRGVDPESLDAA